MRVGRRIAISQVVAIAVVLVIIVVASGAGVAYLASQPNHKSKTTTIRATTSLGEGNSTVASAINTTTLPTTQPTENISSTANFTSQTCTVDLNWTSQLIGFKVGTNPYDLTTGLNGELFVTNNGGDIWQNGSNYDSLSVINTTGSAGATTIPVGAYPWGIAYDSASQEIFESNSGSDSVGVINGSSLAAITNISVGMQPAGVTYDWENGEIYVSNSLSNTVSVIHGSAVVATVKVGPFPNWITFDNATGDIYVSNLNNVSVIDGSTNSVVATISNLLGQTTGIVYDAADNEIYVALNNSNSIAVINGRTNQIINQDIPVQAVHGDLGYDPTNDLIFAADNGSLVAIQGSTNKVVADISVGTVGINAIDYDAYTNEMYFTDTSSGEVYGLNASYIGMVVENPPASLCFSSTTSYSSSLTSSNATITTSTTTASVTSTLSSNGTGNSNPFVVQKIMTNYPVGDIAYDSNPNVNAFFVTPAYDLFPSSSDDVYVINAASDTLTNTSIPVGPEPVDVLYDPDNNFVYVASYGTGNISVINASTFTVVDNISLQGAGPFKMAYNPWNQKIYVADEFGGAVRLINPSTKTLQQNISVSYEPFDIVYDASNHNMYVTCATTGAIDVINTTSNQQLEQVPAGVQGAGGLIAYDPANTYLYYASFNSSWLNVISSATNRIIQNISVDYAPSALAYDPANGEMYVAGNASGGFLYTISKNNSISDYAAGGGFNPVEIIPNTPDQSDFPGSTNTAMFMTSAPDSIYVLSNYPNGTSAVTTGNGLGSLPLLPSAFILFPIASWEFLPASRETPIFSRVSIPLASRRKTAPMTKQNKRTHYTLKLA